jgi:alpha-1,6-mannosyltransferase
VLGVVVAVALIWILLTRTRGRPLYALGLIMSAVVVLGPVVHPWYLLWGVVPLAASTRDPRVLSAVAVLSAGLAFYPMPWGEGFTAELPLGLLGIAGGLLVMRADVIGRQSPAPALPEPALLEPATSRAST